MLDMPLSNFGAGALWPTRYSPSKSWLVCLVWVGLSWEVSAAEKAVTEPDFERDVVPILVKRCLECHNETEANGNLRLTTHKQVMAGGDSGPAVVPHNSDESYLIERITSGEMPPEKQGKPQPLAKREIEVLRAWVQGGANWPKQRRIDLYERTTDVRGGRDWWSLQPVNRPDVPQIKHTDRVSNPIDAFVLAKLEAENMELAPPADKRILIRRLYFDLVGLPPSWDEIHAFVEDASPKAYENLVDRLLKSHHYGERWARYWLDLVRFAETCGYERDQTKPNAWKYRDWVIRSLNDDKPYDRFVLEQLAGDELPDRSEQTVVATGFLRVGTWNDEPNDPQEYKYERLEDMVHATSTSFLGLTVKCARCHDHKFDPIFQKDYYRLASAFWAGFIEPSSSANLGGPSPEQLGVKGVFGWTDRSPNPPALHLLKKGNPKHPGPVVEPSHLSTIPAIASAFQPAPEGAKSSHRRLQFAKWITDKRNPLTPRVFVNRLWQHHFGQALVRTPNNFGFKGELPTHPKLLEWLADQFLQGDWKIKRIHKLMVMSQTYRQASLHPKQLEYSEQDYGNRLWWRAERRRLNAEALRDSMLAVSGRINKEMGGPSFHARASREALEGLSRKSAAWKVSPQKERDRRSVYMFTQRSLLLPLMTTFDFCDTTQPCGQRDVTTVAPQALALLNNHFVHEHSLSFARRLVQEAGDDQHRKVTLAWRHAFGRPPTDREKNASLGHLKTQRDNFSRRLASRNQTHEKLSLETKSGTLPVTNDLVLHLDAAHGITLDESGRLMRWQDRAGAHDGSQNVEAARPLFMGEAINEKPAVRFDGKGQFINLAGQVLSAQNFTIFAVVNDLGSGSSREIFSNWDGKAGNSTTSVFLGATGASTVRFSDDFSRAGELASRDRHFVLTAVAGKENAIVYQSTNVLAEKGSPLNIRNLATAYVIGQQGNNNGEFWTGDIAEIVVYNRELAEQERRLVWSYLFGRYAIKVDALPPPPDPETLALASLCHVLFNANEFIYVD